MHTSPLPSPHTHPSLPHTHTHTDDKKPQRCVYMCAGFVNTILSWKALIPLSRMTYCIYLLHIAPSPHTPTHTHLNNQKKATEMYVHVCRVCEHHSVMEGADSAESPDLLYLPAAHRHAVHLRPESRHPLLLL